MAERGATKHSPRLDDELARDVESITDGAPVESRADEGRLQEGPTGAEPVPDARLATSQEPPPGALSHDDVERRSELAIALRPGAFPASADALHAVAREQHAPPWVLQALAHLPTDREFENVAQVWEALGGHTEERQPLADAAGAPRATATTRRERPATPAPRPTRRAHEPEPEELPEPSIVVRVAALGMAGGMLAWRIGGVAVREVRRRVPGLR